MSDPRNPEESEVPGVPVERAEPVEPVEPAERVEPVAAPPAPPVPPAPPAAYGTPTGAAQSPYGAPAQSPYGAPAQSPYGTAYAAPAAKSTPVYSLISLIAGIVGVIGSGVVVLPFVGGILQLFIPTAAVVLGFIGKKKEPNAKGMWLTGIILGFIGVGIGLISLVFWGILFGTADSSQYLY